MREGMSAQCEGDSRKILMLPDFQTIKTRKIIWFFHEGAVKYTVYEIR